LTFSSVSWAVSRSSLIIEVPFEYSHGVMPKE
jgi:hypothetical protein